MTTILIYGSEQVVAKKICDALRKADYCVQLHTPGESLLTGEVDTASLVILDARVKWSLCRPLLTKLQSLGCPILFLTADKKMVSHLHALYAGNSDVLALPFTHKTLFAKMTALLGAEESMRELSVNEEERVALLDGERVELTAQEFALLLALMENPDIPVSREQLLRKAWGYQSMGETRTVDVHVQRLRKKLGEDRIETVYKCGYRLKMA